MAPSSAVVNATYLPEIGFPEFTAKLITDTFDALVAANLRQMEGYIELQKNVSKTLAEFIEDTKDEISGEMVFSYLYKELLKKMPDVNDVETIVNNIKPVNTTKIGVSSATAINAVLGDVLNPILDQDDTYGTKHLSIIQAASKKIAGDKFEALEKMVKMGVLRLIVDNGVIETRLTFSTYQSTAVQNRSSSFNSSNFSARAQAGTGIISSLFAKASASTSYNSMGVRSAQHMDRSVDGSRVEIFGRVQINFKTDYQPLNQLVQ